MVGSGGWERVLVRGGKLEISQLGEGEGGGGRVLDVSPGIGGLKGTYRAPCSDVRVRRGGSGESGELGALG